MKDIFVGRQPIYNKQLGIYAYEMLFRSGQKNTAGDIQNQDSATSQVVINTFLDMGLDNLVGNALACINLSERFLIEEDALPIPAERVILDIHAGISVNPSTLKALENLKKAGFTLAVEDLRGIPDFNSIIQLTDIYKLNIREHSKETLAARLSSLKKFNVKFLADKVETLDEYDNYADMGFDYFQGYFLSRPRIIKGKTLESSKLSIMQLLSTLHNNKSEIDQVEDAISSDLTLSYKLLKLINSAFFNLNTDVDSIKRAVVFLGRKKLISWASLLALSSVGDQPVSLIKLGMVRAKVCELIALHFGLKDEDQFFTAGMFSALDILMERPIETLIDPLPLADNVKQGILQHKGNIGVLVKCSKLLETSDADQVNIKGISKAQLTSLYLEADQWAEGVTQSIR